MSSEEGTYERLSDNLSNHSSNDSDDQTGAATQESEVQTSFHLERNDAIIQNLEHVPVFSLFSFFSNLFPETSVKSQRFELSSAQGK